jgi:hypothetical protein
LGQKKDPNSLAVFLSSSPPSPQQRVEIPPPPPRKIRLSAKPQNDCLSARLFCGKEIVLQFLFFSRPLIPREIVHSHTHTCNIENVYKCRIYSQERLNAFKNRLDSAAFYILPFLFLVFNTAYWTLYLTVIIPDKSTITN